MGFWLSLKTHFLEPWKKNWAETLHFVVIACSILITGLWVFYTFHTLFEKDKAEVDLKNTQLELEKKKSELKELQDKIAGTDSSNIEISTEIIDLKNGKHGVIITVSIQNTGTNDVDMYWDKSPLTIYKTAFKEDKVKGLKAYKPYIYETLQHEKSDNISFNKNLYLLVGAKKSLSFFVELEDQGLYYITFESKVQNSLKKKLEKLDKSANWFSSQYIYVKDSPNKTPK